MSLPSSSRRRVRRGSPEAAVVDAALGGVRGPVDVFGVPVNEAEQPGWPLAGIRGLGTVSLAGVQLDDLAALPGTGADAYVAAVRGLTDSMAARVDDLDGDACADLELALVSVRRTVEALHARVTSRFNASGRWGIDGARSARAWVAGRINERPIDYSLRRNVGDHAHLLPATFAAFAAGLVSAHHVEVCLKPFLSAKGQSATIREALREQADALFAQFGPDLSVRDMGAVVRQWLITVDPVGAAEDDRHNPDKVELKATILPDGHVHLTGLLDPVTGGKLLAALESARPFGGAVSEGFAKGGLAVDGQPQSTTIEGNDSRTDARAEGGTGGDAGRASTPAGNGNDVEPNWADRRDSFGRPALLGRDGRLIDPVTGADLDELAPGTTPQPARTTGQRNVDALNRILDAAIACTGAERLPDVGGSRPHVVLTVPVATVADPDRNGQPGVLSTDGTDLGPVLPGVLSAVLCDPVLQAMKVDADGTPISIGRTTRLIPAWMRTALRNRDARCRFAGCTNSIDEYHHITYWSHGGPTDSTNLAGLCWWHHQQVHTHGYQLIGNPNGDLHTHRPPWPDTPNQPGHRIGTTRPRPPSRI